MAGQFLIGDALVDALEDAFDRHPAADDIPDLSYFDGALAGIALNAFTGLAMSSSTAS
jgi:hypothetical protein